MPRATEAVAVPPMPGIAVHSVMVVVIAARVMTVVMMRSETMVPEMTETHPVQTPCAGMEAAEAPEVTATASRLDRRLGNEHRNRSGGTDNDCLSKRSSQCRRRSITADHMWNIAFTPSAGNFCQSKRTMMINGGSSYGV